MTVPGPRADAAYREYAGLLLCRHHLLLDGQDVAPRTEEVERRLLDLWPTLDEDQRHVLTGAAADLNWLRREGRTLPGEKQAGQVTDQDRQRLVEAEARKDWHAVLRCLRVCAPVISTADLAGCRAAAYALLGMPEVAAIFRGFAESKSGG